MKPDLPILVIDRQEYWRTRAMNAIRSTGYCVSACASYEEVQVQETQLILLGCPTVEQAELLLIMRLQTHRQHIIVFATSLPASIMRRLFTRGVEDAADKTYDPAEIVETVEQALERIASRQPFQSPIESEIP